MRISDWSSDVCSSDLKLRAQEAFVDRRRAQQQRVARLVAQFAGDQPRLADQRTVVEQFRHAAVGELVATRIPGMAMRDAVWKRVCEQVAEAMRLDIARRDRKSTRLNSSH